MQGLISSLLLGFGLLGSSRAQETIRVFRDVDYANPVWSDPYRQLDIYAREDARDWPVMVYVHGGGWRRGDKQSVHLKPQAFNDRGYIFVSVNYRLTPNVAFPTHAEDVAQAIAWVHAHISEYGGDPSRLFLMGHSAGGHLVSLMGTDGRYLARHGLKPTQISAIIANDTAVYDLVSLAADQGGSLSALYTYTFGENAEFWAYSSPSTYVEAANPIPPMICLYSAGQSVERINPNRERFAREFVAQMRWENKTAKVVGDLNRTHAEINQWFGAQGDSVSEDCFAFLHSVSTFSSFEFRRDCVFGAPDPTGTTIGGTEVMVLTAHQSELFAGTGLWHDDPGSEERTPLQILTKPSSASPWQVAFEFSMPGRIGAMRSVTLTTDVHGAELKEPASLLLASPQLPGDGRTRVFVRDDDTGDWIETIIDHRPIAKPLDAYARTMVTHIDQVTGVHHVFSGTAASGLFRGAFDPDAPGGMVWDPEPELTGTERMHSSAVANAQLYVAVGTNGDPNDRDGGLFRRIDGHIPSWELTWEWDDTPNKGPGLRGLTAVPRPAGGEGEVLLGALEGPGQVVMIDPQADHEVTVEFDFKSLFLDMWGDFGGQASLCAYNDMLLASDPRTDDPVHLMGLFINHPGSAEPPYNGSYFLIRHKDGAYAWGSIYDYQRPVPPGLKLRGARTMVMSPFAKEKGRVLYCGGFDAAGGPWHNSAWIYKGSVPEDAPDFIRIDQSYPTQPSQTHVVSK